MLHGGAEVAFDQAAAQQRDELAEEERFDALGVLEQHGRGVLDALELVMALFEVGLVAVGAQQFGVGELVVVADQREAPVACGVVGNRGGVDGVLDRPVGTGDLSVAGVLAGPPARLLAQGLLGALVHGWGDPAVGLGACQCGGRGLLDADPVTQPALGAVQALVERGQRV